MTKKFFESFKNRFGEVTMIYFCDPYTNIMNNRLDLENVNVENVVWKKDEVTITYTEITQYIGNSGRNNCNKERKVQTIKRANLNKVLFRHY